MLQSGKLTYVNLLEHNGLREYLLPVDHFDNKGMIYNHRQYKLIISGKP